jgi:hypothetical protein
MHKGLKSEANDKNDASDRSSRPIQARVQVLSQALL